jgi:hypothetical protein
MLIDNLANLNRSTRTTGYTALIIIATAAMYNWILAPHITCLSASQRYDSIVNSAAKKNKAVAREVETKTKKLEELYQQLAKASSILFTPENASAFFSNLQTVTEEAGCKVHSLNLIAREPSSSNKRKRPETASGIVANSAILTVSGRYNSIIRLVEKLQNRPEKIWMDSFKMETSDSDSAYLKCDMTITIYTIRDKEDVV